MNKWLRTAVAHKDRERVQFLPKTERKSHATLRNMTHSLMETVQVMEAVCWKYILAEHTHILSHNVIIAKPLQLRLQPSPSPSPAHTSTESSHHTASSYYGKLYFLRLSLWLWTTKHTGCECECCLMPAAAGVCVRSVHSYNILSFFLHFRIAS